MKRAIMPREKVDRTHEYREVIYDERHWELLKKLRGKAVRLLERLEKAGIHAVVHGSIARGDVWSGSDIDVFIPWPIPSFRIEIALEGAGYLVYQRYIAIATPSSTPKAYISLDPEDRVTVSYPLLKPGRRELEFYQFGGMLTLTELRSNKRVPGVNKRLILIEPTSYGHRESPVIGREAEVASIVGVSVDTVLERVRVLTRRDEIGRTGVFVKHVLSPDETFEQALLEISGRNPLVRRLLRERGYL